jgi:23S rRNA pseudouridine2604 synthase
MTDSVRLAKRVVEVAACSRSEAVQYIEGGWVTVDGTVVEEPGVRVLPQQQVVLLPKASLVQMDPATILLHKPAGMTLDAAYASISAATLYAQDRSGRRFLQTHLRKMDSTDAFEAQASGLVVFTQDWRIARKIIDDSATLEHEFIVEVKGDIAPDGIERLNRSPKFNGKPTVAKVSWQSEKRLRFAIKGPQSGQIAYLCELVGLRIVEMRLIRLGRVAMSALPVGQWRYLLGYERF